MEIRRYRNGGFIEIGGGSDGDLFEARTTPLTGAERSGQDLVYLPRTGRTKPHAEQEVDQRAESAEIAE